MNNNKYMEAMEALAEMVNQFFFSDYDVELDREVLSHSFTVAEEEAMDVLVRHGFADKVGPDKIIIKWDKFNSGGSAGEVQTSDGC